MPSPVVEVVTLKYSCPGCNSLCERGLPWCSPSMLVDKKHPFLVSTLCFKCSQRHEITYQVKKSKKIRLVNFTNQEKSLLRKVKKTIRA